MNHELNMAETKDKTSKSKDQVEERPKRQIALKLTSEEEDKIEGLEKAKWRILWLFLRNSIASKALEEHQGETTREETKILSFATNARSLDIKGMNVHNYNINNNKENLERKIKLFK